MQSAEGNSQPFQDKRSNASYLTTRLTLLWLASILRMDMPFRLQPLKLMRPFSRLVKNLLKAISSYLTLCTISLQESKHMPQRCATRELTNWGRLAEELDSLLDQELWACGRTLPLTLLLRESMWCSFSSLLDLFLRMQRKQQRAKSAKQSLPTWTMLKSCAHQPAKSLQLKRCCNLIISKRC